MQQFAIAGAASVRPFNPILSVQHSRKNSKRKANAVCNTCSLQTKLELLLN